jgi:hypothetical protein
MIRPVLSCVLSALLIGAVLTPTVRAEAATAPQVARADTGRVVVTGTASVDVPADRGRVRFAVETEAETAAEAVAGNADRMERAMAALRQALGDTGTLETSGYSLSPVYRQPPRDQGGEPRIAGYRALNHIVVTTSEPANVGRLLDAAVTAGVNRIAGMSFFAEDARQARLDALRQATEHAHQEATVLAQALGMELGSPLEVHTSQEMPRYRPETMMRMDAAQASTPVEPGEQEVSVVVTITYRLGGA